MSKFLQDNNDKDIDDDNVDNSQGYSNTSGFLWSYEQSP